MSEIKILRQCKEGEHVWSRYFVNKVARSGSCEIDENRVPGDVTDFSVCDKCHMVCYTKPLVGIINSYAGHNIVDNTDMKKFNSVTFNYSDGLVNSAYKEAQKLESGE